MPAPKHKPQAENPALVSREFHRILAQPPDIGAANIILGWFFDRPNIFDPISRRRPKPEIVILLSYLLLMAAVFAAFNFR